MLEHLGWDTLEQRRNQLTLLMLYKIINKLVEVPHYHILTKASETAPANILTCIQESIHINSHFSLEPSDSGTLCQIT